MAESAAFRFFRHPVVTLLAGALVTLGIVTAWRNGLRQAEEKENSFEPSIDSVGQLLSALSTAKEVAGRLEPYDTKDSAAEPGKQVRPADPELPVKPDMMTASAEAAGFLAGCVVTTGWVYELDTGEPAFSRDMEAKDFMYVLESRQQSYPYLVNLRASLGVFIMVLDFTDVPTREFRKYDAFSNRAAARRLPSAVDKALWDYCAGDLLLGLKLADERLEPGSERPPEIQWEMVYALAYLRAAAGIVESTRFVDGLGAYDFHDYSLEILRESFFTYCEKHPERMEEPAGKVLYPALGGRENSSPAKRLTEYDLHSQIGERASALRQEMIVHDWESISYRGEEPIPERELWPHGLDITVSTHSRAFEQEFVEPYLAPESHNAVRAAIEAAERKETGRKYESRFLSGETVKFRDLTDSVQKVRHSLKSAGYGEDESVDALEVLSMELKMQLQESMGYLEGSVAAVAREFELGHGERAFHWNIDRKDYLRVVATFAVEHPELLDEPAAHALRLALLRLAEAGVEQQPEIIRRHWGPDYQLATTVDEGLWGFRASKLLELLNQAADGEETLAMLPPEFQLETAHALAYFRGAVDTTRLGQKTAKGKAAAFPEGGWKELQKVFEAYCARHPERWDAMGGTVVYEALVETGEEEETVRADPERYSAGELIRGLEAFMKGFESEKAHTPEEFRLVGNSIEYFCGAAIMTDCFALAETGKPVMNEKLWIGQYVMLLSEYGDKLPDWHSRPAGEFVYGVLMDMTKWYPPEPGQGLGADEFMTDITAKNLTRGLTNYFRNTRRSEALTQEERAEVSTACSYLEGGLVAFQAAYRKKVNGPGPLDDLSMLSLMEAFITYSESNRDRWDEPGAVVLHDVLRKLAESDGGPE